MILKKKSIFQTKKTFSFKKNPNFEKYEKSFLIQSHFTTYLLYFDDEFSQLQNHQTFVDIIIWQVSVKKRSLLVDDFPSIFKNVQK